MALLKTHGMPQDEFVFFRPRADYKGFRGRPCTYGDALNVVRYILVVYVCVSTMDACYIRFIPGGTFTHQHLDR